MTNAEVIASTLDSLLDHEVSLVVYGRSALALGFDNVPEAVGRSLDLDVILPLSQVPLLEADEQFWSAQQRLNQVLENQGLYLTHLFQEDQVFLRPDWKAHIQPVLRPSTRWLRLYRPHSLDLILTKMMRGEDRQDLEDIQFLLNAEGITEEAMETAFSSVRIPDVEDLRGAFERALHPVRRLLRGNGESSGHR
jgi:hypothetical protein